MEVDPFQVLGVEPGCDFASITAAHAARCRQHPELRTVYDQALLELISSPRADLAPSVESAPAAAEVPVYRVEPLPDFPARPPAEEAADADGHLTMLTFDAGGNVNVLRPNAKARNSYVPADESRAVRLRLDPPREPTGPPSAGRGGGSWGAPSSGATGSVATRSAAN